jgi:hypothetical protein
MGGAIVAKVAASKRLKNLVGVAVLDVVEGTALSALSHMHTVLENKPSSFPSLKAAIEWSVASGSLKSLESAKLSIPSQLVEREGKFYWRTNLEKTEQFWKGF